MNKTRVDVGTAGGLVMIGLFVLAVGGWVANIVKMFGMLGGEVTAMFVARIFGIFMAPLGSILGFL